MLYELSFILIAQPASDDQILFLNIDYQIPELTNTYQILELTNTYWYAFMLWENLG